MSCVSSVPNTNLAEIPVQLKLKKTFQDMTLQFQSFNANYIKIHKLLNQVLLKSGTAGTLTSYLRNFFLKRYIMEIAKCKKITSKKRKIRTEKERKRKRTGHF